VSRSAPQAGPLKRACVYVRMSTDKQEDSPERQRGQIDPHCDRRGYAVVRRYDDLGEQGWKAERPGFMKMMDDAQKGLFDVIVVDEMSRLSRLDPYTFVETVAGPLRRANVVVDSVADGLVSFEDTNDLMGFIMAGVRQHKSSQESATTGRRLLTAYQRLAGKGALFLGKPPYGYRKERAADGPPRLTPGPDPEIRTVRFVFDAYANRDQSLVDIARELSRRAVPNPSGGPTWHPTTIGGLLKNEAYIGTYVFNRRHYGKFFRMTADGPQASRKDKMKSRHSQTGAPPSCVRNDRSDWMVIPNTHEPLVEADTFNRVQELIKENSKRTCPVRGRGDFLLTGLIHCGGCGIKMVGRADGGTRRKGFRSYNCYASQTLRSACKMNVVDESELVGRILTVVKDALLNPRTVARLDAIAERMAKRAGAADRVAGLQAEAEDLKKRVAKARKNLALLDEDMVQDVATQIRAWEARKAEIEAELAESGQPTYAEDARALVQACRDVLWRFEEAFKEGDRDTQRALLRRLVCRVVVRVEAVPVGKKMARHRYKLVGGDITLKAGVLSRMLTAVGLDHLELPSTNMNSAGANTGQDSAGWRCVIVPPQVVVGQHS
jgi:site-specific DNA recombinase